MRTDSRKNERRKGF